MEQWKEYRLGEICKVINGRAYKQDELLNEGKYKVLRVGNIFQGNKWYYSDLELPDSKYCYNGDLLYAWSCDFAPYIWHGDKTIYHYHIWKLEENKDVVDRQYLYYYLQIRTKTFLGGTHGSVMLHMTKKDMEDQILSLPSLSSQKRIASILSSLDDKIALNRKINSNLEEQAKALFKSWFIDFEPFKGGKFVDSELGMIPEGWEVLSLDEIADYLNGLAMQKFRPTAGEDHLPVLKIKELGQGYCDESCDICSSNVPSQYIVNDSDIIFSWSGTLKVDIWCGGRCGLNQHLFKVTSKEYPKWFYLMWTLEHLNRFIHIAKDKAVTMGHIKREELHKAKVVVPSTPIFNKANMIFAPILNEMINTRTSNRKLIAVRDTLLPKLMSGEIDVEHSKLLFI